MQRQRGRIGLRKINVFKEIHKSKSQRGGDPFLTHCHSQLTTQTNRDRIQPVTTTAVVEPTIEVRQKRLRKKSRRVSNSIQTTQVRLKSTSSPNQRAQLPTTCELPDIGPPRKSQKPQRHRKRNFRKLVEEAQELV